MTDDGIERIENLEAATAALSARNWRDDPMRELFLAAVNDDGSWKEQAMNGGALEDFPDGRECVLADDASGNSAAISSEDKELLLEVRDGHGFRFIRFPGSLIGTVVCRGPNGEGDFTDNRYWVRLGRVSNTDGDGATTIALENLDQIVCVTNLGERNNHSHAALPGTVVGLHRIFDQSTPPMARYIAQWIDTEPGDLTPCEESSSSQSSSSSESSSSESSQSSGSEPGLQCIWGWSCTYNCETGEWGAVTYLGVNCQAPGAQPLNEWTAASPCVYYFYKADGDCPGPEEGCDGNAPPDAPPAPDFTPDGCCSSSSSGSSEPSSSGSEKSSAIVPAAFTPGGFTALFVEEGPDVRFNDVIVKTISQRNCVIDIDPKFIAVCEPDSIEVIGHSTDAPVAVGLVAKAGKVRVKFNRPAKRKVRLVIRLSGIRRGFGSAERFPNRTRAEFAANERFLKSARPGGR